MPGLSDSPLTTRRYIVVPERSDETPDPRPKMSRPPRIPASSLIPKRTRIEWWLAIARFTSLVSEMTTPSRNDPSSVTLQFLKTPYWAPSSFHQ